MAAFLSAADCGPSHGLKDAGARLNVDRSLQHDRLVSTPNTAGPSSRVFNAQRPAQTAVITLNRPPANAFDLDSLRRHLSPTPPQPRYHTPPPQQYHQDSRPLQTSNWADAFNGQNLSASPLPRAAGWGQEFAQQSVAPTVRAAPPPVIAPWQRQVSPPLRQPLHFHLTPAPQAHFDERFIHHQPDTAITTPAPQTPLDPPQEILASTAGDLLDGVYGQRDMLSDNPKLAQSEFMRLMQGLTERQLVVQEGDSRTGDEVGVGASFVQRGRTEAAEAGKALRADHTTGADAYAINSSSDPAYAQPPSVHRSFGHYTSLQRAPGLPEQAMNQVTQSDWDRRFSDQEALVQTERPGGHASQTARRKSVHFEEGDNIGSLGNGVPSSLEEALSNIASIPGAASAWQEAVGDDLDFDEETFYGFNGPMQTAHDTRIGVGDLESWKDMETQWTDYLGQMRMKEGGDRYLFQSKNPYTAELDAAELNELGRSSPTYKGVLELEAEVQTAPTSFEAWYALGLKQQENEREDQAILALSKVIQLEPEYRDAYLALAVSYTNEGEKEAANTMLEKWIDLGVQERRDGEYDGVGSGASYTERRRRLVERLIDLARASPDVVDADVQIALGVMFNASEEYDKAEDCFSAALEVRPEDWLLYNRLGATLANGGRSQDAVELYHKALSLHPNFVRALFNLGISYINLAEYSKAAQSLLDALRLQHADATEGYASNQAGRTAPKGVTSEVLWTTLRNACLHMGRQDLVALVASKDLAGFPSDLEQQSSRDMHAER